MPIIEIQCPNCGTTTHVNKNIHMLCQKCLDSTGKKFIMVETENNTNYTNLGDGFFEKHED